jgi:hypothetical protein
MARGRIPEFESYHPSHAVVAEMRLVKVEQAGHGGDRVKSFQEKLITGMIDKLDVLEGREPAAPIPSDSAV